MERLPSQAADLKEKVKKESGRAFTRRQNTVRNEAEFRMKFSLTEKSRVKACFLDNLNNYELPSPVVK